MPLGITAHTLRWHVILLLSRIMKKRISGIKNALRSAPNNGQVLNDYGSFLCKRSQFKLAQMQFTKAMALDDYYHIADVYQNSALCWLKEGKPEQAITHFRHTLARDPNRPQTLLNLAKLK